MRLMMLVFHGKEMAALWMVMPRSRSSCKKSVT